VKGLEAECAGAHPDNELLALVEEAKRVIVAERSVRGDR
jgi:hypothetical protein